jgi:hypothetical protein
MLNLNKSLSIFTFFREQGTGNREQGTGNREQGSREQGAGSREQGAGSREQGAGSRGEIPFSILQFLSPELLNS